ncbi:helix-turn-helix domain-containing protein [Caminicella sporogenes]|uniref:helix-turn-helix domain-containing protein n=1 Tax=Caminicella sporogenes TaxID=166485 RepID=UPI00253FFF82|nr:helix-turn-helix transcriptional regulator [Caminicella sporogenes]WIF95002.1 helix-turn-helix transcriptional regulator [Caminicella sporogenes]WIF95107.1 helix-turn-helix transcriptional regulator [Caminicella sporogenes]
MSLKKLLQEKNISGYKLAKEINIPQQTISDYVSGKISFDSMKIGVAKKIADYFGMSLDDFYNKYSSNEKIKIK